MNEKGGPSHRAAFVVIMLCTLSYRLMSNGMDSTLSLLLLVSPLPLPLYCSVSFCCSPSLPSPKFTLFSAAPFAVSSRAILSSSPLFSCSVFAHFVVMTLSASHEANERLNAGEVDDEILKKEKQNENSAHEVNRQIPLGWGVTKKWQ